MLAVIIALAVTQAHVQGFDADLAARTRQNPSGVTLTITTEGGTTFRVGELITLTQTFEWRGHDPTSWEETLLGADDLGGELVVDGPAQPVDPLAEFTAWSPWQRAPAGSARSVALHHRLVLRRHLNATRIFTRPGRYRLFVTSSVPLRPVTSNVLTLTIVEPAPEWQAGELAAALASLRAAADRDVAVAAVRRVRFLGSSDAARELVRLLVAPLDEEIAQEVRLGLYATAHRVAALEEFRRLSTGRDVQVSEAGVFAMALLAQREEEGAAPGVRRTPAERMARTQELAARYAGLRRGPP